MDLSLDFVHRKKSIVWSKVLSFLRLRRKTTVCYHWSWVDPFPVPYSVLSEATDRFSSRNLIGVGSFGSVYKAALDVSYTDDWNSAISAKYDRVHLVAVKVFNLSRRGALTSFATECKVLRYIRHRNVIKIVTACSSVDYYGKNFRALVYQYMENGSLEEWLHPTSGTPMYLNTYQRLSIAIDVACALDYLHNHVETPICHCDIKPSNVLLDKEFTAHISDFGLARFLSNTENDIAVGLRGTVGYAAPEYGMGGQVSPYGDLYSFGILLLEIFSGKKPTDDMFCHGSNFCSFCKAALSEGITKIADPLLVREAKLATSILGLRDEEIEKCFSEIFRIGIRCSTESPIDRLNIRDVVFLLRYIRDRVWLGIFRNMPCYFSNGGRLPQNLR